MLKLDKICVSFRRECQDKLFGHTKQQVLFDVSAEVKKGTCLGILGESGSGKSTMGRVLCGLLKPDSGTVFLNGVSVYGSKQGGSVKYCFSGLYNLSQSPFQSGGYFEGRPLCPSKTREEKAESGKGDPPAA